MWYSRLHGQTFLLSGLFVVHLGCLHADRSDLPAGNPFADETQIKSLLAQGIAVGDVTSDSAVLWTRTDGPALVRIEYAPVHTEEQEQKASRRQASLKTVSPVETSAEQDFIVKVRVQNLLPATHYRYRVSATAMVRGRMPERATAEEVSGEFKTAPASTEHVPVLFGWSGDLGGQERCRQVEADYPIFDVMLARSLDFFLFLGDTVYVDETCPSPPNVPGGEFAASSLEEFRAKHRYQRGAVSLRHFLAAVPLYVMWDDHEVTNNFSGPFEPLMPKGRQSFQEYWPIHRPADDPHRLYRRIRYGADLEIFFLDTRQYRSRNSDPDGPTKTMLGEQQLAWLLKGLKDSAATWKVIASSVPLSIPKSGGFLALGRDGWAGGGDVTGFETELRTIVDAILRGGIRNIVWLAADVHFVQANAYDPNGDGVPDFHEYIAGPLSAASSRVIQPSGLLNPRTLISEAGYMNFGTVLIDRETFRVTILDDAGAVRFTHQLRAH